MEITQEMLDKAMADGILEGKRQVAIQGLKSKMTIPLLAGLTGLSVVEIVELSSQAN